MMSPPVAVSCTIVRGEVCFDQPSCSHCISVCLPWNNRISYLVAIILASILDMVEKDPLSRATFVNDAFTCSPNVL